MAHNPKIGSLPVSIVKRKSTTKRTTQNYGRGRHSTSNESMRMKTKVI